MNWIITIPKTVKWDDYIDEVSNAEKHGLELNYKLPYKINAEKGDKCFVCWNGLVRGWTAVDRVEFKEDFNCLSTGRLWKGGYYLVRKGKFNHVTFKEKYKGFRGIRKYTPIDDVVRKVIESTEGVLFDLSDEKTTQDIIFNQLSQVFNDVKKEFPLPGSGIIDFYVDGIGIEVKLKTTDSAVAILRQCERYCKSDKLKALVLMTARSMGFPVEINEKPCYYISLSKGML